MSNARNLANLLGTSTTIPSGKVVSASLPTGAILQVKQGSDNTEVLHTTGTWADTNLSVSITPISTSSDILILINQSCYRTGSGGGALRIMRDSTAVFQDSQVYQCFGNEASNRLFHNMQYLDSPGTTSAITYKTQGIEHSGDFRTNQGGFFYSRITVMEIAG